MSFLFSVILNCENQHLARLSQRSLQLHHVCSWWEQAPTHWRCAGELSTQPMLTSFSCRSMICRPHRRPAPLLLGPSLLLAPLREHPLCVSWLPPLLEHPLFSVLPLQVRMAGKGRLTVVAVSLQTSHGIWDCGSQVVCSMMLNKSC